MIKSNDLEKSRWRTCIDLSCGMTSIKRHCEEIVGYFPTVQGSGLLLFSKIALDVT